MNQETLSPAAGNAELFRVLEAGLSEHFGQQRRIAQLQRRPSEYRSSYLVEDLDVLLEDGMCLAVVFKDLSRQALLEEARDAKPEFLYDPRREIDTYRGILSGQALGTATCYGAVVDRQAERYWLFLERVSGRELYQVGEIEIWRQAARWLAGLHGRMRAQGELEGLAESAHLLRYSADYYRLWMRRALRFAQDPGLNYSAEERRGVERLAKHYDEVAERLAALPATLIHGEYYASNILIGDTGGRVCPVDWEMAAIGPGLVDLAALTAGSWRQDQREAIALAYRDSLLSAADWGSKEGFLETLDFCHLYQAVQWLGWSPRWTPPPQHANGWLNAGLGLAEKLGL